MRCSGMQRVERFRTPAAGRIAMGRPRCSLVIAAIGALLLVGTAEGRMARSRGLQDVQHRLLQEQFDVAVSTFQSAAQRDSIAMFDRLIASLQPNIGTEDSDFYRDMMVDCLQYRARAHLGAGAATAAEEDIRTLIRLQPDYEPDLLASDTFLSMFDLAGGEMVGWLEFSVLPDDAAIRVDGALLESSLLTRAVLAGPHTLVIEKPGYQPVQEDFAVVAGESTAIDRILVRESAVLHVYTMPAGATVSLNGRVMGTTRGTAPRDFVPPPEVPLATREDFSAAFVLQHLQPGTYTIEITLDGYRARRSSVAIPYLEDFAAKLVLEPTAGTVVLEGLTRDADVVVDNLPATPQWSADDAPSLVLPPGEHTIEASRGTEGIFFATLDVLDRQTHRLRVEFKPGLAFLGFLGGDEGGVRELKRAIERELGVLENWAFLDRGQTAPLVLERLGLTAERLRAASTTVGDSDIDWTAVQGGVDREAPGSVYLLVVPSDDIYANYSDLWIWPSAPGPTQPDRVRVRRSEVGDVAEFASAFATPVTLEIPWFGALLVDVGDMIIVAEVTAEAPAGVAGLSLGDRVVSIAGEVVGSASEARRAIERAGAGVAVAVQVQRGPVTEMVEVRLDSSPSVISPFDPDLVYPAISASLVATLRDTESTTPEWVVKLNQAAVLLHAGAWEDAVGMLTVIREDAPSGPGLGRAAIDYWLGIALSALGTRYTEGAIGAFTRAAEDPGGRLFDNDGPRVAPRARARLAELG